MKTLRSFIEEVKAEHPEDYLEYPEEVDPRFEVTALVEELIRVNRYPVVFFPRVKGSPHPIVVGAAASRKLMAYSMGAPTSELVREFRRREKRPVPPERVSSAPVQEVVKTGRDLDITQLPHITAHVADAGPYVTAGLMIAKDPETGVRNASFIRCQIVDRETAYIHIHPGKHLDVLHKKAERAGRPLPVAVSIGNHPLWMLGSLSLVPIDVDELAVIGGLMEEPLRLARCVTSDLDIMADAEIVLEGEVLPHERAEEGPFGEFTGYAVGKRPRPVLKFKAVTHRRDPIYQTISSSATEHCIMPAIAKEAYVFDVAKGACPTLQNIHVAYTGRGRFHYFVSIDKQAEGQPRNVAMAVFGADLLAKQVVVVDKDVDIFDEKQVLWAIATRLQGDTDIVNIPGGLGSDLDPSNRGEGVQCKTIFDATAKPSLARFAVRNSIPQETVSKMRRWLGGEEGAPAAVGASARDAVSAAGPGEGNPAVPSC
ncbi:MAG: UbiD family decarboxylase [Candidatus Tectomicrobia bacterium]|nr:UbiD family decarboxylase [Candidatus Tectomicrobia bacterium]